MAGIINGEWRATHSIDPELADIFDHWITMDGSPGPTGRGGFAATEQRYHLYLARGCPYSHRVLIAVHQLGFKGYFSVTLVDDVKRDLGWQITEDQDLVFGADSLHAVMISAEGNLTAKCAVPILVDKESRRLVSTSSADMVRMLDNLADALSDHAESLWPDAQADSIDTMNLWIDSVIGRGVYMTLFASEAAVKKDQVEKVRAAFQELDQRLSNARFLHGQKITASDVWLFPTLLRFNSIYAEIFGLNFKIENFKFLGPYMRDLWTFPAFSESSDLPRIEEHYYRSHIHGPGGPVEPGKGRVAHESLRFDLTH